MQSAGGERAFGLSDRRQRCHAEGHLEIDHGPPALRRPPQF